jgi:hypothetical protein
VKKWSDYDNRTWAKGSDFTKPLQLTPDEIREEEMPNAKVDPRTGRKQLTPVLYFPPGQFRYGVVLTAKVNRDAIRDITGSDNIEDAIGVTFEFWNDLNERNPRTGEPGAIRIRQPTMKRKPMPRGLRELQRKNSALDQVNLEAGAKQKLGEPIL